MIQEEQISKFLEGRNQQKYIVSVEIPYGADKASLVINDPVKGKYIKKDSINSFVWFKEDITKILYGGNRNAITKANKKFGVTISRLKTNTNNQPVPNRMANGFKFMAKCNGNYGKLLNYFKKGGIDVYGDQHKHSFITINPIEQYLISSGKRLFKGMEDYDDLHRLQFDLETTGLHAKGMLLSNEEIRDVKSRKNTGELLTELYEFDSNHEPIRHKDARIFQIGVKDNRGFEEIIEIKQGKGVDDRQEEFNAIFKFFEIINKLEPDTIAGYNSENFDWDFIFTRCDILGVDIELIAKTLDKSGSAKIKRVDKSLKLGGVSEHYKQTIMWGYNIIDVYHAVRRAKAINSNIKKAGLKYITKFSKLNKPNRVYVDGDKIYTMWADETTQYAFNDIDGTYYVVNEENPLKEGYNKVIGKNIIRRYLLDDLWETEQVDAEFNQAAFLLSKIIPTSYMRSTTMGTAGIWKLIMLAWSFENRLAIPEVKPKQSFVGGLSRLIEVGYAKKVAKLDFAALYPNIEITHDIFPDTDISGVMKGMLIYIATTRDKFKGLMNDNKAKVNKLKTFVDSNRGEMESDKIKLFESQISEASSKARMYDKKQLPIKILGNSFFGSLGAPNIFPWGDVDCAEETTCRGRQYLRLMVEFFVNKGFRPLVGDTDGFNFGIPDNIDSNFYTPLGTHRFTNKNKGKTVSGLDAVVDEFNELFMIGRMGLDIDDICETTINFSRKNYANLIGGKIKLVGNTIKSSKMPIYIEEFLDEGIKFLLNGDGFSFIQLYNRTVEDIYNFRVPLLKIASKANVKQSKSNYVKDCKTKTKAGNYKARKAYMELLIANNITASLGDTVYYVNTGKTKSKGDVSKIYYPTDGQKAHKKEYGTYGSEVEFKIELNCVLIPSEQIENDPNLTTDEYNVAKYLGSFNKRIKPLLVCFKPEIRDEILIDTIKSSDGEMGLTEIKIFTKSQCELGNGNAFKDGDQDTLKELMTMSDKEIEFWIRTKSTPNNLSDLNMDWDWVQEDFYDRKKIQRMEGIQFEKNRVLEITKRLEIDDYSKMLETSIIPKSMSNIAKFVVHNDEYGKPNIYIRSIKWEVDLGVVQDILKYKPWAIKRASYYEVTKFIKDKTFEGWLENYWVEAKKNGELIRANNIRKELELVGIKLDVEKYKKVLE